MADGAVLAANSTLLEAAGVQWDKLPTGGMGSFEWKSRDGNDTTFAAISLASADEVRTELKKMIGNNPLITFED
jgi:hypothetical protein